MFRQQLLHRVHRRYPTTTSIVEIAGKRLNFTRIADPDAVLDDVARREDLRLKLGGRGKVGDELSLPYWAELWESSLALARLLPEYMGSHINFTVLDLGCGMGLCGTAAAALGASVTFADLETTPLLLARYNALGVAPAEKIRACRCDWRTTQLGRRFDLILGADILYDVTQWPYLEHFWTGHLASGGCVLLAEPGRQSGERFIEWIGQRHWQFTQRRVAEPHIRVFILRAFEQ